MLYLEKNMQEIITWSGFALLVLFALWVIYPLLIRTIYRLRTIRRIKNLGFAYLQDVVIPDGLGGEVYIEYLILSHKQIYVLLLKRYQGVVFAADHIDFWTQVVKNRSYKFPNPLPELDARLMAVRSLLPNVPVDGYLLALEGVEFPKGRPERLLPISMAKEKISGKNEVDKTSIYENEWQELASSVNPSETKSEVFASNFSDESPYWQSITISMMLFLAAIAWLYWRSVI